MNAFNRLLSGAALGLALAGLVLVILMMYAAAWLVPRK